MILLKSSMITKNENVSTNAIACPMGLDIRRQLPRQKLGGSGEFQVPNVGLVAITPLWWVRKKPNLENLITPVLSQLI